jgi:hypothetical protein
VGDDVVERRHSSRTRVSSRVTDRGFACALLPPTDPSEKPTDSCDTRVPQVEHAPNF